MYSIYYLLNNRYSIVNNTEIEVLDINSSDKYKYTVFPR